MIGVGDSVKDKITGLTGIAVCRTEWLYGCVRVGVQPRTAKDGKIPEIEYIDEPQLKLVKREVFGPEGELPTAAYRSHGPSGKEEQRNRGRRSDGYYREE